MSAAPQSRAPLVCRVDPAGPLAASPLVPALEERLGELLAGGFPPSVSLAVVSQSGVALEAFGGYACVEPEIVAVGPDTSYDLASLTKVVCSTTLVLAAAERGELELDVPVRRFLPEYPVDSTRLWHLLTHTSGLVDHRPFFVTLRGRAAIERAVYDEAVGSLPDAPVLYSDLNFMLVGWLLEACLGRPLDGAFTAGVCEPLGMLRTGFRPVGPQSPEHRVGDDTAATELDGDQRNGPGLIWGEVHDGNAWALGGVSGHAGLFAPRSDLARFVRALLAAGADGPLSAASVALMATRQAANGDDVRGIGWRLDPEGWGDWPAGTFWHTGFTGTSLLVSPGYGVGVVLLMNGVHPRRRLDDQAAVRAELHQMIARSLA